MVALVQVLISVMLIPVAFAEYHVHNRYHKPDPPATGYNGYLKVSPNAECGRRSGFGCRPGDCCSKFNFCGTLRDHCGFGCQTAFGSCDPASPPRYIKVSTDGRCGREHNLKCRSGTCCSQYGFCGSEVDHCGVGCQTAFGLCNPTSPAVQPTISQHQGNQRNGHTGWH
ncbi:hypothetical protein BASA50_010750 [Batrachochytrium salamandrivorans]|uniref:Chitin-binding type-1 domain-containing protein n=1 Tax=Batrachochytrium salamandrivorans TaxID=1357716 RepID=A0ABQ8EXJ4_9FUNG|nr:hypothetical protein BASA50_010750 [Batrachochytrium salamandrivorans]